MNCPRCGEELEKEDTRCSTDRGTYGRIEWWCELCGDMTEEVGENELYLYQYIDKLAGEKLK